MPEFPLMDPKELPAITSTDLKKYGLRGLESAVKQGPVVVTNHSRADVVALEISLYEELVEAARRGLRSTEADLGALRARFDERLASLSKKDAGKRLRAAFADESELEGRVVVGKGR